MGLRSGAGGSVAHCAFVAALGLLAVACSDLGSIDDDRARGSGAVVTEIRPVETFDRIVLAGEGHVLFAAGSDGEIEIETDDNLLSDIETTVSEGTLTIKTRPGVDIDPTRGVVDSTGVGRVVAWVTEDLDLRLSGVGEIRYYGEPDVSTTITGIGTVDALGPK